MKKFIIGLSLALGIITLFACEKQPQSITKNTLIVGLAANYPPYESYDIKGELEGFDVDIAKALGKQLNKQVIFKDMGFDALVIALKQGKIDLIISAMSITDSRQKEIAMIPYFGDTVTEMTWAFWNEDPQSITNPKELLQNDALQISVVTSTYQENYLRKRAQGHIKTLESIPELIMDLKYGKSDVALFESHIANTLKSRFQELYTLSLQLDPEDQTFGNGIGIHKENSSLIEEVSVAIHNLREKGSLHSLQQKWFGGVQ